MFRRWPPKEDEGVVLLVARQLPDNETESDDDPPKPPPPPPPRPGIPPPPVDTSTSTASTTSTTSAVPAATTNSAASATSTTLSAVSTTSTSSTTTASSTNTRVPPLTVLNPPTSTLMTMTPSSTTAATTPVAPLPAPVPPPNNTHIIPVAVVVPIVGVLLILSAVFFWVTHRRRKQDRELRAGQEIREQFHQNRSHSPVAGLLLSRRTTNSQNSYPSSRYSNRNLEITVACQYADPIFQNSPPVPSMGVPDNQRLPTSLMQPVPRPRPAMLVNPNYNTGLDTMSTTDVGSNIGEEPPPPYPANSRSGTPGYRRMRPPSTASTNVVRGLSRLDDHVRRQDASPAPSINARVLPMRSRSAEAIPTRSFLSTQAARDESTDEEPKI